MQVHCVGFELFVVGLLSHCDRDTVNARLRENAGGDRQDIPGLAACFVGSVSGFGFSVEILSNVGHCLLDFLERLACFCGVPVFDAANVCTDSTEEVLFIQHH